MLCDRYKTTLTEAAASGVRWPADAGGLSSAVREHLNSCGCCQKFFAREQTLFAAIDCAARRAADMEIPPALVARMQATVAQQRKTNRGHVPVWAYAIATASLILMVLVVQQRKRPQNALSDGIATIISTQKNNPIATRSNDNGISSVRAAANRLVHSEAHGLLSRHLQTPEIFVEPGEEAKLMRFCEALQSVPYPPSAVVNQQNDATPKPVEIAAIEIARLQFANSLEGGDVNR